MKYHTATLFLLSSLCFFSIAPTAKAKHNTDVEIEYAYSGGHKYAFLPYAYLNMDDGYEVEGVFDRITNVHNCSNESLNCLNGNLFKLAWPKICRNFNEGQTFHLGGIETKIFTTFSKPGRHGLVNLFLAKTNDIENRVYILQNGRGLVGIIYDPVNRGSLVGDINSIKSMDQLKTGNKTLEGGYLVSYLVGLDYVGECIGRTRN